MLHTFMTTDSNGFNHTNEQEHNEFCSAMIGFMEIDFDCFTPKTCEEAEKAILEVEEEIKAGKFVPIEVVLAETDKKIREYNAI